jgi:hypothetical protein
MKDLFHTSDKESMLVSHHQKTEIRELTTDQLEIFPPEFSGACAKPKDVFVTDRAHNLA